MMPNMNGYKLLNKIRSNAKTRLSPVILLTAKAGELSSIKGSTVLQYNICYFILTTSFNC